MAAGAVTVIEDTPAREIAQLMHAKHIKRVPVVRDSKLVGIVARSDLETPAERASEHGAGVKRGIAARARRIRRLSRRVIRPS
jgi:CBS-domain-containing membrane protein